MSKNIDARELLADTKFFESYSRFVNENEKYEKWSESVERVMDMHRGKYLIGNPLKLNQDDLKELTDDIDFAEKYYKDKKVLGAQRALQFGGEQLLKHNIRLYNCVSSYCDRPKFFGEFMYMLLCGAGAGFSVQYHHIEKLPKVTKRTGETVTFEVTDSIEGWAEAVDVLMSSFFVGGGKHPEYEGKKIHFDLTGIRLKGELIAGHFKAPGPEPLRKALDLIEALIKKNIAKYTMDENGHIRMNPIDYYDICMYIADAVISGGVRRSATICMFSKEDTEMVKAKTGNWYDTNPQRGRSNNSAVLERENVSFQEFEKIMVSVQHSGEPGFIFTDNRDFTYNPCFTGETIVAVADGRNGVPIKDLADDYTKNGIKFPVYSARDRGITGRAKSVWKTEIKMATAFKTGTREIIEVKLSNGTSFKCTPNHELATPDGRWIKAKDSKGERLEEFFEFNEKYSKLVSVDDIIYTGETEDVYDLTVDDNHNFYILTDGDEGFKNSSGVLVHNCVEIGKYPQTAAGVSGWQGCNLCEINGSLVDSLEEFLNICKAASILGTLQAGYTDFKFLAPEAKEIFEKEALIGVSITGWMNSPDILFDKDNMIAGAEEVKSTNKRVAKLIKINPAARTTCVKPSGNASVLLQTSNGIHGEHSKKYFRHVQLNKESEVAKTLLEINPDMLEESAWSENKTDWCAAFPIVPPENSILKKDLLGVKQLDYVKLAQEYWVEYGTNEDLCVQPGLRHNVSNTITVDDWDEVTKYVFENRYSFCGISFLAATGDKAYMQAPNAEVLEMDEIIAKYGDSSLLCSALIEAGLNAFNNDLWSACNTAMGFGENISIPKHENAMKRDWVRRFEKFASNFIDTDTYTEIDKDAYESSTIEIKKTKKELENLLDSRELLLEMQHLGPIDDFLVAIAEKKEELNKSLVIYGELLANNKYGAAVYASKQLCTDCLKDVYYFHKWWKIQKSITHIDWAEVLRDKVLVDIDTMAAIACAGGACEV